MTFGIGHLLRRARTALLVLALCVVGIPLVHWLSTTPFAPEDGDRVTAGGAMDGAGDVRGLEEGTPPAELDRVRVFPGAQHARLLLLTDVRPSNIRTRSSPSVGRAPARGIVTLDHTWIGPDGARTIKVDEHGLRRVIVTQVGDSVQITVELDDAPRVRIKELDEGLIVVDLQLEAGVVDAELPEDEELMDWVEDASLGTDEAGARTQQTKLVVLDAGHGGFDFGAIGLTGTREADVALQIARRVAQGLEDRLGVTVLMTRDRDVYISLADRAALANDNKADLFLSIHANAAPTAAVHGIETYSLDTASNAGAARVAYRENALAQEHSDGQQPNIIMGKLVTEGTNRLSQDLATSIQSSVIANLRGIYGEGTIRDLGPKTALFYVLVSTRMPAILFEASFLTNPQEERRLRTAQFQQATADALVGAVGEWLANQE
jgi:N-acetylmuramoyl-L-alanine amidase